MTAKQQIDEMVDELPMMPSNQTVPINTDVATSMYNEFLYLFPAMETYFKYAFDTKTGKLQRGTVFIYRGVNFKVI